MTARPSRILSRGIRKRCGRCGAKAPFHRYFKLGERCTRCGYRFAREEGFFTGVFLINYAFTAVILVSALFAFIVAYSASEETASTLPYFAVGLGIVVVVPIGFYPHAATTWAALDLSMRPLEPDEEAEAACYAAALGERG